MYKCIITAACAAICASAITDAVPCGANIGSVTDGLDFSRAGYGVVSVSAEDFLEDELSLDLFEGEREFISAYNFGLRYSDKIAGNLISAEQDSGDLQLSVRPLPYRYTASNGAEVVWSPVAVNGTALENGEWHSGDIAEDYVTVTYSTSLSLPAQYVNSLLNAYYNAAESAYTNIKSKEEEYGRAFAEYEAASKDYNDYLAALEKYNVDAKLYGEYLEKYSEWQNKNRPYLNYLKELDEYNKKLDEYRNFNFEEEMGKYLASRQKYMEYLQALEDYDVLYNRYLSSIDTPEMAKVRSHISIIEYIYKVAGGNRTIRSAIMGDSVTQVLTKKDELTLAGVEGFAVDVAARATKNLRDLITKYDKLETEEEKYGYYVSSYESLKDNFCDLLRCLDYFYRNSTIRNAIAGRGKEQQYLILVAQLYEIANALDNNVIGNYEKVFKFNSPLGGYFDENYRIADRTPGDILGDCLLADTNDAEPLENGYPFIPPPPEKPEEVVPLPYPEYPSEPIPPEKVASPGEPPAEVAEPQQPAAVEMPSAPEKYTPAQSEQALAAAFENKTVVRRDDLPDDEYVFDIRTDVKKYFRNFATVTAYFYADKDSNDYIVFESGERGSFIAFPDSATLPVKQERGYVCTFSRWLNKADDKPVDWENLPEGTEEVHLYAEYTKTPLKYPVIWVIDGKEVHTSAEFGTIPVFDGVPFKQGEGLREYRFTGWDKQLVPVDDLPVPARYVALFESNCIIEWKIGENSYFGSVWKGETPRFTGEPPEQTFDSLFVYSFGGVWDREILPASGDETYTAVFSKSYILSLGDSRGAQTTYDGDYLIADCSASALTDFGIYNLLSLASQLSCGIKIVAGGYSVSLAYADVYSLVKAGAEVMSARAERTGYFGGYAEYAYYVDFYGGDGAAVEFSNPVSFAARGLFGSDNFRLFWEDGSGSGESYFSLDGNEVSFSLRCGRQYAFYPLFNVNIAPDNGVGLSADIHTAKENGTITLSYRDIPAGMFLKRLFAVDKNGEEIAISADNTFKMPASDVTVGALLGNIEYTVTFKVDGKTISRKTYIYGQEIVPPTSPVKAPDGENSYTFAGWDRELEPVTGDAEYNAVFTSERLADLGSTGMSWIMKLIIAAGVVVLVAVLAAITVIIVVVVKKVRRRKR